MWLYFFGFMGWDLGKQLGGAKMKTQLQRQVPTIYFIEIMKKWLDLVRSLYESCFDIKSKLAGWLSFFCKCV
jgi:hypothetical protein